ncbi:hypothetical protein ACQ4PT_023754 [Festuca glaucescens]
MNEGDDDLFEDNVVDADQDERHEEKSTKKSVKVKEKAAPTFEGKGKACKEDNSEEEDLWGPESNDDTAPLGFKTFREVDLADPQFHVGQTFESVELLRKAIQAYSCKHRKDIKLQVNDLKRLNGRCTEECSCNFKVHSFTSNFLAQKYLESFRADQDMNMKNFSRIVQKEWCMTPGRCKLQRARRLAMKIIYGDEEGQYKLLWDYGNEIRRSNPGSSFYVSLDENSRFKRCYMCLEASKKGFLQGCRPMIFLDGCFIKTRYRGQLLAEVGVDPNDCIFPIAVAAVEVEDTANWTWFLDTLKADLGIENIAPWTVMSNKQKGLINDVKDVFPDSEHRYILEARELPVLSMFERIKGQIMSRNYNKQNQEEKWPGVVCPKIKKRVLKNVELSNNCYADGEGDGLFAVYDVVSSTPVDYIVDLKTKTCTCSRWQKSGIPCPHVASVATKDGIDPLSLVDNCYSIDMHRKTYGNIVYPCKDKSEWEKMGEPTILPPSYKKHVGRPTKNRRKAPGEVDCRGGGKRMSRHGVIMHCSHCGRPDHNRNGCYWFKNGLPAPDQPQGNNPPPTQP